MILIYLYYEMSRKTWVIKTCELCAKEYYVSGCRANIAKYCSKACWNIRKWPREYACKNCNVINHTYDKQRTYCSQTCRDTHYRTTHQWANSHFWKWGKTKESKIRKTNAEYKDWRLKVFTRDWFECQQCWYEWKRLEAHHIKEQSKYPELIYEVSNWLTLCHDCHKMTDNYGSKANKVIIKRYHDYTKWAREIRCLNRDLDLTELYAQ